MEERGREPYSSFRRPPYLVLMSSKLRSQRATPRDRAIEARTFAANTTGFATCRKRRRWRKRRRRRGR